MKTTSPSISKLEFEIERLKREIARKDRLIGSLTCQGPTLGPAAESQSDSDLCNALFNLNPVWTVLSTIDDGIIVKANSAFYQVMGYREEEVVGRSAIELGLWADLTQRDTMKQHLLEQKQLWSVPLKLRIKSGQIREFFCSAFLVEDKSCLYALSMSVETDREGILEKTLIDREIQAEKLAERLQELDTTIRVIADAWGREKVIIASRIERHIHANIIPYIEKLKESHNGTGDNTYLQIIEENLKSLNPMFSYSVVEAGESFTASENHVIQLIRQGKSSKEIAERLNVSTKAVSFHRSNIRRKLNLVNKKVSLATYLNSQGPSMWPLGNDASDSGETTD